MGKLTKKDLLDKHASLAGQHHELRTGVYDALGQLRQINGELYRNKSTILNIALASVIKQFNKALIDSHPQHAGENHE